jgi:hypothetical protein
LFPSTNVNLKFPEAKLNKISPNQIHPSKIHHTTGIKTLKSTLTSPAKDKNQLKKSLKNQQSKKSQSKEKIPPIQL